MELRAVARDLRLAHDETVPGPDGSYPRPIISTRSTSRPPRGDAARGWTPAV
ncbi:hypothetical protein [Desertihabitans brevis]|uniref:hypothetical protein n=1 Tax=Desertihabitans brevis TaxID=2268447 RepID=UPI001313E7C8|nr:hypothetical protein [Desertihabitans brevis]